MRVTSSMPLALFQRVHLASNCAWTVIGEGHHGSCGTIGRGRSWSSWRKEMRCQQRTARRAIPSGVTLKAATCCTCLISQSSNLLDAHRAWFVGAVDFMQMCACESAQPKGGVGGDCSTFKLGKHKERISNVISTTLEPVWNQKFEWLNVSLCRCPARASCMGPLTCSIDIQCSIVYGTHVHCPSRWK